VSVKSRDPRQNPEAGDSICFRGWTVSVLGLEGDSVRYSADKGEQRKVSHQTLEEWRSWAPGATVERVDGVLSECFISSNICGPCMKCGKRLDRDMHVNSEGCFCDQHCSARNHIRPKQRKASGTNAS
jgi:hypothetical protein